MLGDTGSCKGWALHSETLSLEKQTGWGGQAEGQRPSLLRGRRPSVASSGWLGMGLPTAMDFNTEL